MDHPLWHLLDELEHTLREAELWQAEPVPAQALLSVQPFCCDTLRLEQWLQFVFIVKMRALIQSDAALPANMAIAPMAEVSLAQHPQLAVLLSVLQRLDAAVSESAPC
ncbi:YqcC family protein [Pseudoalteromonas sp. OOF1S-7]|uniref:YqcC family protein n=1 Tax=Pseudoalteromonas sp. OOF1S-7 TaxID=2917757 RepID=UPI001EF5D379|nr:YqcC family protein [Pseudoalteromonas sp. OOF1S-7]MCG7534741.1 YqcC family protein [Pseudoalteromonas sp. OOF1S-7]